MDSGPGREAYDAQFLGAKKAFLIFPPATLLLDAQLDVDEEYPAGSAVVDHADDECTVVVLEWI